MKLFSKYKKLNFRVYEKKKNLFEIMLKKKYRNDIIIKELK